MQPFPVLLAALALTAGPAPSADNLFEVGTALSLEKCIPTNERGILCLARDAQGRVYGGTTGRAAHLFVADPATGTVRSLARLEGGVGFAHGLVLLSDGSLVGGTQADPTGIAVKTEPGAVGRLVRFHPSATGPAKVEVLGVPVPGQGIYTLAHDEKTQQVVGLTWPEGHFFSYDLASRQAKDHGAIAGYRTFETPKHAEDLNRGTNEGVQYPRQVSRAIAIDPGRAAYTAGATGLLYRYDLVSRRLEKLTAQLPAARGREPWASLDAALVLPRSGTASSLIGGTSDGYLFELGLQADGKHELRPYGKPLAQGTIQGLVAVEAASGEHVVHGVGGGPEGMPRAFALRLRGTSATVVPGGIPRVEGQLSMVGFGALLADGKGGILAGERDRLGRLVRYTAHAKPTAVRRGKPAATPPLPAPGAAPPRLDCHVVFAPAGTTTDGSGYTAIEVGRDGLVYTAAARYGGYGWLLRFDPAARPLFMDRVVSMREVTGERRQGINTQGKIHAKLLVGSDGRVWFASKQAHEIFDTRPEYGEDDAGFPGGHLCYYDPKTGFSRSLGILKPQEGLMAGALDESRGRLYYRSEPKNHFLVYDLKSGDVQDRGHTGANCRYMATDKQGRVYSTSRGEYLSRYDPATGYVEDIAIKVEGEGHYTPPYVLAIGPNGKLYGAVTNHPWIMEFDIDRVREGAFPEVTMRNVAPAAPNGLPVQDIHAGVFGKDGRFYYPLNTVDPSEPKAARKAYLLLMRFDPTSKTTETVGVPNVVGLEEEKVKHSFNRGTKYELRYMQGAAVGPDGSLYLLVIYPQMHVACFPKLTAPR